MIDPFLTPLDVRNDAPGEWELLAPFAVRLGDLTLCAPVGMVTDFASVPRLPFAYSLFGNIGHKAAVIHDYLYATGRLPRDEADKVLRELLIAEGVTATRADSMYAAVRMFGAKFYFPKG